MGPHEDSLEKPKSGQVTELFPYALPFHAARVIGMFIILMFTVIAVAAILVDWPETVEAPFVLLPESGADPVQSPFDGVIESVHASTRGEVDAGEVLFTIRSARIQELAAHRRTLEKDLESLATQRDAAEENHAINRNLQEAEIAQREKEVTYRRQFRTVYKDVLGRMESLSAKGLASSVDMLSHRLGEAEAERDVALADEQYKAARLALTRLDAEHQQELNRIENEERRVRVQLESLDVQLRDVKDDLVEVRAPCNGIILSVARKRTGDVVGVGQELCQIAPAGATARAHLQLAERGMAQLREGQRAKLLFEAFPYQRYGIVEGTLTWMSPATVASSESDQFIAHVKPDNQRIGTGNYAHPLRSGMRGTARIQVGRRTLIEYAFEPLRSLRENMRDQGAAQRP